VKLRDRVAVITGGGTGMGRAIAERFAAEGAKVVVNYRASQAEAEETVAGIQRAGGEATAWKADVSLDADARAMMTMAAEHWGRLDILVNNAGWSTIVPHHQLEDLTDEIWDRTLNSNLRGAFYCSRAAAPLLAKQPGASIINNTSASAWHAAGSSIVYCAAKAALDNMPKSLARALAPGIRVTGIAPALVHTRFAGWPDSVFENGPKQMPLERLTTVEEIAAVALFLAADATAMTAEVLLCDGGRTQLMGRR